MKQYNKFQKPRVLQESETFVLVYKPIGHTPLEVIQYIKQVYKKYDHIKMGYAGRLDPMAEGLMLLLLGEENQKKVNYEQLRKEYAFECTFGIKSDTVDLLGLISYVHINIPLDIFRASLQEKLQDLQGDISLPYPIYSAKRVKGKPLYYWARKDMLEEIDIPTVKTHIYSIRINKIYTTSGKEIAKTAISRIKKVNGNFRQEKIIEGWEKFAEVHGGNIFPVADITADVSAGTYIRAICEHLGEMLGTKAIATNIKRTTIGDYHL